MSEQEAAIPNPEQAKVNLGYIRLTDSAPIVMAAELGLYEKYGLQAVLHREVSWANLRDKLVAGTLDAAQILAPLPLATTLGAGGMRANMVTGLALSLNGNAITLSAPLTAQLADLGANPAESAHSAAAAVRAWLDQDNDRRLTLASAHSFSCHTFQLHTWLESAGVDPERDVRIFVLPPEQMVDSLARGLIDGFCVGEPWSSVAVQHGIGAIHATGYAVWHNAIEKVLGVTEQWHNALPGTHLCLRLALMEACRWLADDDHRLEAAEVLARPEYLDLPVQQLLPSLSGQMQFEKNGPVQLMPHFHVFGRFDAGFPWRSTAEDLLQRSAQLLGREMGAEQLKSIVQQTYRTDLYREAARRLGMEYPESDYRASVPG